MLDFRYLNSQLDADQVLRLLRAPGRWETPDHWRGACPCHQSSNPRSRSLSLSRSARKWTCHNGRCRRVGDLIDLYACVRGLSLLDAARELAETFCISAEQR